MGGLLGESNSRMPWQKKCIKSNRNRGNEKEEEIQRFEKKFTVKLDRKRRANTGDYCMTIGLNSDKISRITSDTLYIVQSLI